MGLLEDQAAEMARLVDKIVTRDRQTYGAAMDDYLEADETAMRHERGHELYAVERYLRCLCVLALADFSTRRGVHIIAEESRSDTKQGGE